jgi:hypothetical protein
MNTSHNKNIVINDGWLSTVRNALSFSANFNLGSFPSITQCIPYGTSTRVSPGIQDTEEIGCNELRSIAAGTIPKTNKKIRLDTTCQLKTPEIYTVSEFVDSTKPSTNEYVNSLVLPYEAPCTSNGTSLFGEIGNKVNIVATPNQEFRL